MNNLKNIILSISLLVFGVVSISCKNNDQIIPTINPDPNNQAQIQTGTYRQTSYAVEPNTYQSGIHVTGESSISLEPDLVLLNVGVESSEPTVTEARQNAATAMNSIHSVLKSQNIENRDIKTKYFDISPQYEYQEILKDKVVIGKQVLVGYKVTNSASIRIRELNSVGTIIDKVTTAGGDVTRINGISFTIEDQKPIMTELRKEAVTDAVNKAQQFAELTGVMLGSLLFITENNNRSPMFNEGAFARSAFSDMGTQISGGELEVQMNIEALFAIR